MTIAELAHIVRSAAQVTGESDFIVVGSQAILGTCPDLVDPVLTRSAELDLYPLHEPELADDITGSLGELSPFHEMYGYYADGVGPETSVLPPGWEGRLVKVQREAMISPSGIRAVAYCLDPHDLLVAKYVAGRHKDIEFCEAAIRKRLVDRGQLEQALRSVNIQAPNLDVALASVQRAFQDLAEARFEGPNEPKPPNTLKLP